jgi:hypothetical protein
MTEEKWRKTTIICFCGEKLHYDVIGGLKAKCWSCGDEGTFEDSSHLPLTEYWFEDAE